MFEIISAVKPFDFMPLYRRITQGSFHILSVNSRVALCFRCDEWFPAHFQAFEEAHL